MAKNPENAEFYRVSGKIAAALKRDGFTNDASRSKQCIFNVLSTELAGRVGSGKVTNGTLKEWMDNPMSPEDEAKALRAMLHMGLSDGNISPQILDKLDRIIGINTGEDEKIEIVNFATAFPDLDTAIKVCMKMLKETNDTAES